MHLFAGAGGGLLADLILGHTPVCAVEWDPYCCHVIRERAADGWFSGLHVQQQDCRLFDPSPWAGRVDSLHAGFPCQDISFAGRGAGLAGERSGLWSEVRRCADVLRPAELFLENSPAIVGRGLDRVLADLAAFGYDARWLVMGADDVGANHQRERWWCRAWLRGADAQGVGRHQWRDAVRQRQSQPDHSRKDLADATGEGSPKRRSERSDFQPEQPTVTAAGWWSVEPRVGRVVDGLAPGVVPSKGTTGLARRLRRSARAPSLEALGNGQVPLCAAAAYVALGGPVT